MENTIHWLEPVVAQPTSPTQKIVSGAGILGMTTTQHDSLLTLKNEIDKVSDSGIWDDTKKITNPYEYIFLSLQKRMHRSISSIVPLSRSYYKMIELWDLLQLKAPADGTPLLTAHSAEGPGGFLEAIQHRVGGSARMIAMTLRSTERSIPGWRKSLAFLNKYPDVLISYGADNTGNLYSLANQAAFRSNALMHLKDSAHIYTADGGFDFSADFNAQENTVQRLLAAEALCGLNVLCEGGTMIIKVFDTKNLATLQLLWMISMCFDRTGLVKPHTSRPANSERYWIGQGFRPAHPTWVTDMLSNLTGSPAPLGWDRLFQDTPYSDAWFSTVKAFQETVEEHQFHNIQMTLNIIKQPAREHIQELLMKNIHCSREWCVRHGITLNPLYAALSDQQIASQNLEEALVPFPALGGRTHSQAESRPVLKHHVLFSSPVPPPPAGPAWRSALPASILGPKS